MYVWQQSTPCRFHLFSPNSGLVYAQPGSGNLVRPYKFPAHERSVKAFGVHTSVHQLCLALEYQTATTLRLVCYQRR
jgi:hypothetical protein